MCHRLIRDVQRCESRVRSEKQRRLIRSGRPVQLAESDLPVAATPGCVNQLGSMSLDYITGGRPIAAAEAGRSEQQEQQTTTKTAHRMRGVFRWGRQAPGSSRVLFKDPNTGGA